jgi:cytidylate kinase
MDTGLLYRAVALNLLRWGGDPSDERKALGACDFSQIDFADPELKSEAAGGIASRISAFPLVRAALIKRQRDFAEQPGGAVLDGRDIGTVIAPDAGAKLFVTASPEERAARRCRELQRMGLSVHYDDVLIDIRARDERDANRDMAPLRMAEDAELLDTSGMTIDAALARAIEIVERRRAANQR